MTQVKNKWNNGIYTVIQITDNMVLLRRSDGTEFGINHKEYKQNYKELHDERKGKGKDSSK